MATTQEGRLEELRAELAVLREHVALGELPVYWVSKKQVLLAWSIAELERRLR